MSPARSGLLVFVVLAGVMIGLERIAGRWWSLVLQPVLVPALLIGERRYVRRGGVEGWYAGLVAAVAVVFGAAALGVVLQSLDDPPLWDFPFFWLNGTVAADGLNFYDPEHVWRLAAGRFPADQLFTSQLPFKYPPPTMLLFVPLGFLTMERALACWYVVQIGALAFDVAMLRRLFLTRAESFGLAVTAALVLAHRGVFGTLLAAQTNFIVLLMILLYWKDREVPRGGVWLALGAMVKPLVFLVMLHPFVRRRWRTLAAAAVTLAAAWAASGLVFGPAIVRAYFTRDPALGIPSHLYTEPVNQSLLAVILRATGSTSAGMASVLNPLYLAAALVVAAITIGLAMRLDGADEEWGVALTVTSALLLYPATLVHYAVVLLAPMLLAWERRPVPVVAAVLTASYALAYRYAFMAIASTWLLLVIESARLARGVAAERPAA